MCFEEGRLMVDYAGGKSGVIEELKLTSGPGKKIL